MMYRKSSTTLKQTRYFITIALAALILAVFVPSVFAKEKPAANTSWDFQVAPYMWFLSLEGDVTVKGRESDLDFDFSDIWDELNIAGMLTLDARKGNWGIFGDMIGANLGKSKKVGEAKIDPTIKLALLMAGGAYRLGTWKLSDTAGQDYTDGSGDDKFKWDVTYHGPILGLVIEF